jgi:flagellar protein FliS
MTYAQPANRSYLQARVATASQPELQLMLLDGALRFGRKARESWYDPSQGAEYDRLLARTIEVAEELVRSVTGRKTPLSARLEEEYAYAYRALVAAQLHHDAGRLDSAIELLAYQRETWRLAWENARSTSPAMQGATPFSLEA